MRPQVVYGSLQVYNLFLIFALIFSFYRVESNEGLASKDLASFRKNLSGTHSMK